jgi:hypothetical protein
VLGIPAGDFVEIEFPLQSGFLNQHGLSRLLRK